MQKMVVVFPFLVTMGRDYHVILVRKKRPDWQEGLLNGPGGKVEEGESFVDAAQRELLEETGVDIPVSSFIEIGEVVRKNRVRFFTCRIELHSALQEADLCLLIAAHTDFVDEPAGIFTIEKAIDEGLPQLRYQIPVALQAIDNFRVSGAR